MQSVKFGLRYIDSDYKRTLQSAAQTASLRRDALLHRTCICEPHTTSVVEQDASLVKGFFGPAGIDQREMQAGCQNGQQRWRTGPKGGGVLHKIWILSSESFSRTEILPVWQDSSNWRSKETRKGVWVAIPKRRDCLISLTGKTEKNMVSVRGTACGERGSSKEKAGLTKSTSYWTTDHAKRFFYSTIDLRRTIFQYKFSIHAKFIHALWLSNFSC